MLMPLAPFVFIIHLQLFIYRLLHLFVRCQPAAMFLDEYPGIKLSGEGPFSHRRHNAIDIAADHPESGCGIDQFLSAKVCYFHAFYSFGRIFFKSITAQLMLHVPVVLPSSYFTRTRLWAKAVRFMPQLRQSAGCSIVGSAEAHITATMSMQIVKSPVVMRFMINLLIVV